MDHSAPDPSFAPLSRTLDYPLYIVTTRVDGERSGCLIGFATQCSVHPPRFLACLSTRNHTYRLALRADVLALHVVEERNRELADLFGGETGDEVDKFARVSCREMHGAPVLDGFRRWFVGRVLSHVELGDHVGFHLEPLVATVDEVEDQLTFQQARDISPGHRT